MLFRSAAQGVRKGVMLNPLYPVKQLFRDSFAAPLASGADFTPVMGALRQLGKSATKNKLEARGITGGQVFTGTNTDLTRILKELQEGHVGLGTFRTVEVEDLTKHKMDSEQMHISQEACTIVNKAIGLRKKVCAIGTTSMRAIESSVSTNGELKPYDGWTNKFVFPPYDFSIANCMVTNFHTPESTLLMMVSAFGGYDLIMEAYKSAIKEKYKFYTYGDAMLIL